MSTPLCVCSIAIDTNVFEHLFNPKINKCNHINKILQNLIKNDAKLLVDSKSQIPAEYLDRLPRYLKSSERINEVTLLRYWLNQKVWKVVPLDKPRLMTAIRNVMGIHGGNVDKTFVYVAFHQGENLISNDFGDLVEGHAGNQYSLIRNDLRRKTKQAHTPSKSSRILTSQEAFELINSVP